MAGFWRPTWLAFFLASCNAPIVFEGPSEMDANLQTSGADAHVEPVTGADANKGAGGSAGSDGREAGSSRICSTDPDCRFPSLHCDTVTGTCVSCFDDSQCAPPLSRCDLALGKCVRCGNDIDCPTGQMCTDRKCLSTCRSSTTCPVEAPLCDARGLCVRCVDDAGCTSATTPYCHVATGQCVACNVQQQCLSPAARRCDPVGNVCVGCLSSADCEDRHFCNPMTNVCVDD
jgi:hypothetical protein